MSPEDLPPTMKAWRYHQVTNGPENHMKIESIPLTNTSPMPPDSTLIRVSIVALNPVDVQFSAVPLIGRFIHPYPAIPGHEGMGQVVKTSDSSLQEGQMVMFRLKENQSVGALAEYVLVPREGCVAVPDGVLPVEASTVGCCGVTGYQALTRFVKEDDKRRDTPPRVFINGGSGGTGVFQIQIAKALGYHVTTSCSAQNIELCKSLGADHIIDYRKVPVEQTLTEIVQKSPELRFDLIIDNISSPWSRYKAADTYLKPEGHYVQIGIDFSTRNIRDILLINLLPGWLGGGKRRWTFMPMRTSRDDAATVLGWMAEGKVKVPIDSEFGFEDVPDAYRRLHSGRTRGKIVVYVEKQLLA